MKVLYGPLFSMLVVSMVFGCTPQKTSYGPEFDYYKPHPPTWFAGTWQGDSTTKEYHYKFKVGASEIEKEVRSNSSQTSGGMVASTITFYHGYNGKYLEEATDNRYELKPEKRPTEVEIFSLNASGSIDYTFSKDGTVTQSVVLEKQ